MVVNVVFIRHPESSANESHIIAGSAHVCLADYGKKTGKVFAKYHQEKLVSQNPLLITGTQLRSTELAINFQAVHSNLTVVTNRAFNERDFGIFGGRTKSEMIESLKLIYPEEKDKDFSLLLDKKNNLPGGFESNDEVKSRIAYGLSRILSQYPTYDVVWIITSTGIIRNALSLAGGITSGQVDEILPNNKIPNLSMTTMYYDHQQGLHLPTKIAHIPDDLQEIFNSLR